MEQRNELLRQMKLTERQKKGDVQHLLSRSFSRKSIPAITPLSPPGEVTLAVPQFSFGQPQVPSSTVGGANAPQPIVELVEVDTVSIEELSVEPRIPGGQLIDLSTPNPPPVSGDKQSSSDPIPGRRSPSQTSTPSSKSGSQKASPPVSNGGGRRTTPPSKTGSHKASPPRRMRKDSGSSSSDDSSPEEQSVRTPLLDDGTPPPVVLPMNTQPSIKRYDEMFNDKTGEDEIPLGGTADSFNNQP